MRAPLEDPIMADFVEQLAEVNALADVSPGFVWRLADESGGAATDIRAFDDDRILINMSVWDSIDALHEFSYRGRHAGLLRDRGKWFEAGSTQIVLWWMVAGAIPSVDDAKRKTGTTRGERLHRGSVHVQRAFSAPALADFDNLVRTRLFEVR